MQFSYVLLCAIILVLLDYGRTVLGAAALVSTGAALVSTDVLEPAAAGRLFCPELPRMSSRQFEL